MGARPTAPAAVLPNKGSVGEIITQLAQDEVAISWRSRQTIESSGCGLSVFDQHEWARLGDYASSKRGIRGIVPPDTLQPVPLVDFRTKPQPARDLSRFLAESVAR